MLRKVDLGLSDKIGREEDRQNGIKIEKQIYERLQSFIK